ncbi:hypothetical protein NLI96_g3936 [Meripilus lineatus]|uniref:Phosphogluconate dehydrogenase NAD-binding putative C-terminal domain-containing protein n=1 Tax=Meripilus lineatus TaxID=2056292 RepID=A0AAD5VBA7_9APHY|nr:hypothetical protein NLI96_g3936 [Physisporinus lineatus]
MSLFPAAHSSSPATADALLHELAHSQPLILQRIISSTPNMLPKAYRWVGEMEEISSFVGGGEASTHHGLASLYQRVDNALQHRQQGDDIDVLSKFVEDAKKAIAEK